MSDDDPIDPMVTRTIALAQSYRRAATALLDQAHTAYAAGQLAQADFNRVFANYLSVLQKAMDINNAASHLLAEGLGAVLDAVEGDTAALEQKLKSLQRAQQLVGISIKLLLAVGAVALAVIAPNPGSLAAAGAALGSAVGDIVGAQSSPAQLDAPKPTAQVVVPKP
jgi:hypothetical protein